MNRRILCLTLSLVLLFSAFIPFAEADNSTLYASDGRTITVDSGDVELWKNVGWFESEEDARIITMYSMDGRTIDIPQYYREAYEKVGWYSTREEVCITMYSMDGRSLEVFRDVAPQYNAVGWYYTLEDVTVKMYDGDGHEFTIFKDNVQKEKKAGLSTNKNDVMQLMFSADGRFIHVPYKDVEAYKAVGWYCGGTKDIDPSRPMVSLTYDDGPGKHTDRLLSILEKYNVKATFFVQGKNAYAYRNTLLRASKMGCEIANHTYSHANLSNISTSDVTKQISSANSAVYNITGKYPALYRPPYGAFDSGVLNAVSMPAVMWSVDTLDWKTRDSVKTLESVRKNAKDGSIILMHDIHSPTVDAAENVIRHLLMQGYQLVNTSDLIKYKFGSPVKGKVYYGVR